GHRSGTVQLGVIHPAVAGHQPDGNGHNGLAQAAYFDAMAIYCQALGVCLLRGLYPPHSIIEPYAIVGPLLEEPAQLTATCRFRRTLDIRAGDMRASSHQEC